MRYQYPVPEDGLTLSLCVMNGRVVIYASTTVPNPNKAYYDYMCNCSSFDCNSCEIYVGPDDFSQPQVTSGNRRRKRTDNNSTFTNFMLYIAMEGVETNNTFELQNNIGDTSSGNTTIGNMTSGNITIGNTTTANSELY